MESKRAFSSCVRIEHSFEDYQTIIDHYESRKSISSKNRKHRKKSNSELMTATVLQLYNSAEKIGNFTPLQPSIWGNGSDH